MINRLILKLSASCRIAGPMRNLSLAAAIYVHAGLLLAYVMAVSSYATEKNEASPPRIATVSAYRAGAEQLAFRIEFTGMTDPARLRILLDVDGRNHGEPNSGADYMLEGTSFYRYPEGAKGWQWTAIEPPVVITRSNQIVCLLPKTFHVTSAHWTVEITDQSWITVDRFPKEGQSELRFQDLPTLPNEELARQATVPGLKITSVVPLKVPDGGLAFKVSFAASPDPSRFRLMLDTDQSHTREPNTGADYMLEGVNFYSYPSGASNWTWNAMTPPVVIAVGNTLTYVLLEAPPSSTVKWLAATTNPHLSSLSCRFDKEIKMQRWEAIPVRAPIWEVNQMQTSFPIRVTLADVVSGQTAVADPARAFRAGDTMRLEGTTLGVDWTLIAAPDGDGDVWLSGELRSDTNRCLRIGIGCSLNLINWAWHDDMLTRRSITASSDPYGNVTASPCGVRGEQSLYPFGVISSSHGVLIAETDPDDPRVFQVFAETDKQFFGVYYDLAITPNTAKFPGKE